MPEFCHLHCHTQYSLLDGAADIDRMMKKAKADGQPGIAITDHGNMFGAFKFYLSALKNGIKPILGCEFYIVEDRHQKTFEKGTRDKRYHQLLLAKNAQGYKNLSKLCSLGFTEGMWGNFPRIDMELLKQYSEGLIASTCCVAAMVPRTWLEEGPDAAEKVFLEHLDLFKEDYYIEIQRHGLKGIDQDGVNEFLIGLSKKHNVKLIATNDSHYVDKSDAEAHDILLCINTGAFQSTPKGDAKGERFGFENDEFYFKTKDEMYQLYKDIPEAMENTIEIFDKIDTPKLKRDILLPNFTLPKEFLNMDDYLKHVSFLGARKRFGDALPSEVVERLEFELKVMKDMGFAGYFLIVQDFIAAARKMGVAVGPGRGSAAGSLVAFCTGITNIDPIKYNLLFERFLNPERVSMPDIDIDFDDDNRQKVIDYVVDKYGQKQVAQIITYGTMAAKSSIKDVGRVMQYPLAETDKLTKMIPEVLGITLAQAYEDSAELKEILKTDSEASKILKLAKILEGSVRQRGIHAAGVIIAPEDITNYIPVCTAKDSPLLVTQFDGKVIESAGMLKMDFLGLKTLSIIRDAMVNVKKAHGIDIDIDEIPLDDPKTFELYQNGEAVGTFQFESDGMRQYLRQLKPTTIEDLIAMNALYRPGPMDYIPNFIDRKQGREVVEYPHEWLEGILKPTYGIMVYQEQIMQTAQIVAGFSLGRADVLRRAMGKKDVNEMQKMQVEFVAGAKEKGVDVKNAEEIFEVMAKFALYGFNRSHSAAYSVVAFQTAYLKANYPAEYMAAVLTHNMGDIKKVEFFLSECNRMKVKVLGPDVNESNVKFAVNKKGEIRFALSAVKGVGSAAVEELVLEREKNGPFNSIFDLAKRANLRSVNKKAFESLAYSGGFDSFGYTRSTYFFHIPADNMTVLEKVVKFGNSYQRDQESSSLSLFGDVASEGAVEEPAIPTVEPWGLIEELNQEKDHTGIYLSGHPLDTYKLEMRNFVNCPISEIENHKNRELALGGIITGASHRLTKTGNKFGSFTVEDFDGSYEFVLFGEDYIKFNNYLSAGHMIFIRGTFQLRRHSQDQWEFKIRTIELLSDLRDKMAKSLTLRVALSDLDDKLVNELEQICKNYPGNMRLDINIYDTTDVNNKTVLEASSGKYKINLDNAVVDFLDNHPALKYKLN
jgi:DNA polymerase-3 subunit alpha